MRHVSGLLTITIRDGNMAALLCEEVFPPAWKKHLLASLDHLEFGKRSKDLRMHPGIDEVFSRVYRWLENVLIGVFPVDSWPFQLSVGKNPSVSFLEASNLQDSLKSGVWGMSLGRLLGISLIPNAVGPFLMV